MAILYSYLRWRALQGDPRDAWRREVALWFERLGRTDLRGADLIECDFSGTQLQGVDLHGARLWRTRFFGAQGLIRARFSGTALNCIALQRLAVTHSGVGQDFSGQRLAAVAISGARLQDCNLRGCDLMEAELTGADLQRVDLREARLDGARLDGSNLSGARLDNADLRGANLTGATLEAAQLTGARIDLLTFKESGLSADELFSLHNRGAKIVGLDAFPESVRALFMPPQQEGLTLYFHADLDRFDRVLVEGTIVSVLGRDTDCNIDEFRNLAKGSVMRLVARQRTDLERVAEALYRKVWEVEQARAEEESQKTVQVEQRSLVRMFGLLQSPQLRDGLSSLRERLETMELREARAPRPGPGLLDGVNKEYMPAQPTESAALRWRLRMSEAPSGSSQYEIWRSQRVLLHHAAEDRELAEKLRRHLAPLVREGLIELFACPLPGAAIAATLERQLEQADALLALVSADYLAADDCMAFLERARSRPRDRLHLVPVLVRPTALNGTPLFGRMSLPEGGRAVTEWQNQDAAWKSIADGLRLLLRSSL